MFSLSEKVFVWLVRADSVVQAQLPHGSLATGTVFCSGNRVGALQEQGAMGGLGFLQGLGREPLFPSSHAGAPLSSSISFWDMQKSCFAFPYLQLSVSSRSSVLPYSPLVFPARWGKGTQLQKKGGGGKENKWCRAGTEKWSQTLVRRVPRAGRRMQWLWQGRAVPCASPAHLSLSLLTKQ